MFLDSFPAGIHLLKVKNRNTRTRCEICSTLTIKMPNDAIGYSKLTIETLEQSVEYV